MQIEINDDGIVSFTEKKILKQVEFKDFLEQMNNIKPISTGFLPKDCIFYQKEGDKVHCVFEDTPQIRFLGWKNGNNVITYPISMPFLYWILAFQGDRVTSIRGRASIVPVRSLEQEVFNMGLPNFHGGGESEMCRGSGDYSVGNKPHSSLRDVINKIWETNWNGDLHISYPDNVTSFKQWGEETIKDPLFWMKLQLKKCSLNTIGGLLENH